MGDLRSGNECIDAPREKNNGVTTVNFDVIFDSLAFSWLETLWIPQSGGL